MNMDPTTLPPGVTIEYLLQLHRKTEELREKQRQFLQTEEGKKKNREAAALHYERHKAEVLLKRKKEHEEKREQHNARALAYYHAHREEILAKRAAKNTATDPA
jgi:hypothetical protein